MGKTDFDERYPFSVQVILTGGKTQYTVVNLTENHQKALIPPTDYESAVAKAYELKKQFNESIVKEVYA